MASGDTLDRFFPADNEPPSSTVSFATLDTNNNHPVLDFDTTTSEIARFTSIMPQNYSSSGITITAIFGATSATTGTIGWLLALERISGGFNYSANSFGPTATIAATTVTGTASVAITAAVSIANGTAIASISRGDLYRLQIARDVAADTAAGDAELLGIEIRET